MKIFFRRFGELYLDHRIPVAAAALSYDITMTFFPTLICLYTLLGNRYDSAERALEFLVGVLPESTMEYIRTFVNYVSNNYSVLMMLMAFSVILVTSSAAFRNLETTIGRMQGGTRFEGYVFFLFSVLIALVFVLTVYLAIIAMFMGENVISLVNRYFEDFHLEYYWSYLRYILLFAVSFVMVFLIFELCKRKEDHYSTLPGTLVATLALVGVSIVFSFIINASIKYPLVYSSLSSIILLMFWCYCGCMSIYCGAVTNIAIRDIKEEKII